MSDLQFPDKKFFEKIFQMQDGYVLDLSSREFKAFFQDYDIDIEAEKYAIDGVSKGKRLKKFWEIEHNSLVASVNRGLLFLSEIDTSTELYQKAENILQKLESLNLDNAEIEESREKEDARRSVRTIIQEATYLIIRKSKMDGHTFMKVPDVLKHPLIENFFDVLGKYQDSKKLDFKLADNDRTREAWITEALKKHKFCKE
jgi:hypothetical protein